MKKIICISFILLTIIMSITTAFAQNNPVYFNNTSAALKIGKDESGFPEKIIDINTQGGYGWGKWGLGYNVSRFQPLSQKTGALLEQCTMVSLGICQINDNIVWGFGPSISLLQNFGSNPKTSRKFFGANGHVDFKNENFHIAGNMTFDIMSPKNQYDWARNVFFTNGEGNFFFSKVLGLQVTFGVQMYTEAERRVMNQPFNQNKNSVMKTNAALEGCAKLGPCVLFAGLQINGAHYTNTYIDQQSGMLQKNKYSPDKTNSLVIGAKILIDSE